MASVIQVELLRQFTKFICEHEGKNHSPAFNISKAEDWFQRIGQAHMGQLFTTPVYVDSRVESLFATIEQAYAELNLENFCDEEGNIKKYLDAVCEIFKWKYVQPQSGGLRKLP